MFWKKKAPPKDGPVIEVNNLDRTFGSGDSALRVLRGLNLSVSRGSLIALYGPSGSGKTTLLNLIGALDKPTGGSILFNGQDITRMREAARSRLRRMQIGFIFQTDVLIPTYTAV